MSKYTTGEIARLSGVSVRTVQYYDDRGILIPSELSEGGRRLYNDDDLKRMHIICFLREVGFPINSIAALLAEEKPQGVIGILLDEQEESLRAELSKLQAKLGLVMGIKRELRELDSFSVESIGDIAYVMKRKNKLSKLMQGMLLCGIPLAILQIVAVVLGITNGLWWLLAIWAALAIPFGIVASVIYYKRVAYICPECHAVFKPTFKKMLFAYHTPKMRRLTCKKCSYHGLCVEVYDEGESKDSER